MGLFSKDYKIAIIESGKQPFLNEQEDHMEFFQMVRSVLFNYGYSVSDVSYNKMIKDISFSISKGGYGHVVAGSNALPAQTAYVDFTMKRSETFSASDFARDLVNALKGHELFGSYNFTTKAR